MATEIEKAPAALQELVAQADTGARKPTGATGTLVFPDALAWALFQLWYASPLPFTLNVFNLNSTEMRALHLGFGLVLAYLVFPFAKRSPRDRIPLQDWLLAAVAAFCGADQVLV